MSLAHPGPRLVRRGDEAGSSGVRLLEHAGDVDAVQWAGLASSPFDSRAWFLAMEDYFRGARFRYFCAFDGPRLVAILPVYDRVLPGSPAVLSRLIPSTDPRIRRLTGRIFRAARPSLLVAGSPYALVSDVIGNAAAAPALHSAVKDYARSAGVDFVAVPQASAEPPLEGAVAGPGTSRFVLDLPGRSVEDYIAAQKSKYRSGRRREFSGLACTRSTLAGHERVLADLRNVTARRHRNDNRLPPGFYGAISRHMGDSARVLLVGERDAWRGAALYFAGFETVHAFQIGVRQADGSYFRLMAETIRVGYELGARNIDFGPNAAGLKLKRGCHRVGTTFSCAPVSARSRWLLQIGRQLGRLDRHASATAGTRLAPSA